MGNPILHQVPHEVVVDASPGVESAGRVPLGRLLVAQGFLTEAQLDGALVEGDETGVRLGEIVVHRGHLSEDQLAMVLAEQWGLSYVDRASIWFDADALARLSREDAQRLGALPTRVQDGRVVVAVAEPTEQRLDALRRVIGEDTVVVVVPKSALDAGLSSELLASRGATESISLEPTPSPSSLLPGLERLTSAGRESASAGPPPVPTASTAALGDVEALRERVRHLESELARQRSVTVDVQLHLQAALRTLLLDEVGRFDDPSKGGGPAL
jgi:hypothetical protein